MEKPIDSTLQQSYFRVIPEFFSQFKMIQGKRTSPPNVFTQRFGQEKFIPQFCGNIG